MWSKWRNNPGRTLKRFLWTADAAEANVCRDRLCVAAEPIILGIISRKLGVRAPEDGPTETRDEDDARAAFVIAITGFIDKLQATRAGIDMGPIAKFDEYVAVAAYRACDEILRRKYPQRAKLKNRVHDLLRAERGFATWETRGGEICCGFTAWAAEGGGSAPPQSRRLRQLTADPRTFLNAVPPMEDVARMDPARLVAAILTWVGHGVPLDVLVMVLASLWNIHDRPPMSLDEPWFGFAAVPIHDPVQDSICSIEDEDEARVALERIWNDVCELRPSQRAALLLNLRDNRGAAIVAMLPVTGVARQRDIARALDLEELRLKAIWSDLPLDDLRIAELLGVSQRDVVNLRLAARRRLSRHADRYDLARIIRD
jgi:hypothetical protein